MTRQDLIEPEWTINQTDRIDPKVRPMALARPSSCVNRVARLDGTNAATWRDAGASQASN